MTGYLKYPSGDSYEGELIHGRREGRGVMKYANGDWYIGAWRDNKMCDADGQIIFHNGNEYRGGV